MKRGRPNERRRNSSQQRPTDAHPGRKGKVIPRLLQRFSSQAEDLEVKLHPSAHASGQGPRHVDDGKGLVLAEETDYAIKRRRRQRQEIIPGRDEKGEQQSQEENKGLDGKVR